MSQTVSDNISLSYERCGSTRAVLFCGSCRMTEDEAGPGRAGAAKAMTGYPPLHNYSVEERLAPTFMWLVEPPRSPPAPAPP